METAIVGCLGLLFIAVAWAFFTALGGVFWGFVLWALATYLLPSLGYTVVLEQWQWFLAGIIFQLVVSALSGGSTSKE